MRAFERGSLADVVARLRPGMKVLLPPAWGEPVSLVAEICRQADRLVPLTLMGGIYLGDYPFCRPGAVRLTGRGEKERATALITVAHPRFREELEKSRASGVSE
jgi:hypothetical protein